jgi:hypothetical protein
MLLRANVVLQLANESQPDLIRMISALNTLADEEEISGLDKIHAMGERKQRRLWETRRNGVQIHLDQPCDPGMPWTIVIENIQIVSDDPDPDGDELVLPGLVALKAAFEQPRAPAQHPSRDRRAGAVSNDARYWCLRYDFMSWFALICEQMLDRIGTFGPIEREPSEYRIDFMERRFTGDDWRAFAPLATQKRTAKLLSFDAPKLLSWRELETGAAGAPLLGSQVLTRLRRKPGSLCADVSMARQMSDMWSFGVNAVFGIGLMCVVIRITIGYAIGQSAHGDQPPPCADEPESGAPADKRGGASPPRGRIVAFIERIKH